MKLTAYENGYVLSKGLYVTEKCGVACLIPAGAKTRAGQASLH
jgi:hypothetical protein